MHTNKFEERLKAGRVDFHPVVPFTENDKLLLLNFTATNKDLTPAILADTVAFSAYVENQLKAAGATYGVGGYNEHRTIYQRSVVFDTAPSVSPEAPPNLPEGEESAAQGPLMEDHDSAGRPTPALPKGGGSQTQSSLMEAHDNDEDYLLEEEGGQYGYQWADPNYYKSLKAFVLQNRAQPTLAENVLWKALKGQQLGGYSFRRQHIIDKYIADFVCLDKRLIIEVDGLIHQLPENRANDKMRTEDFQAKGFSVIRFTNEEVIQNKEHVLQSIISNLNQLPSVKEYANLSSPFGGQGAEPRRLHLGVDIWGAVDTPVYAPLAGTVHSFAFNEAYGDYGATLILQHEIDGLLFHTLYGHLSLKSIQDKHEGQDIEKGSWIASFGDLAENGNWPPHLHFQLILDMQGMKGDYPGVCKFSEREQYLANCPDADLLLNMLSFAR